MAYLKSFHFVRQGNDHYDMLDHGFLMYRGEMNAMKGSQTLRLRNSYDDVIITITLTTGNAFSLFHTRRDMAMSVEMEDMKGQLIWEGNQLRWQLPSAQYTFAGVDHSPYVDMIMSRDQEVLGYSQGMSCWLKSTSYSAVFAMLWMFMQQRYKLHLIDEGTFVERVKEAKR